MKLFEKKEKNDMCKEQNPNMTDETPTATNCNTESGGVPVEGTERKLKVMISQPMAGKPDGEIVVARERAIAKLEEKGYEVINTLFTDAWYDREAMEARGVVQVPLCFLAKSLENMSRCHAAYFCDGWENARGCRIEHDAAKAYGLDILYETEPDKEEDKEPENSITLTRDEFSSYKYEATKNYTDKVMSKMYGSEDAGKDIAPGEKMMIMMHETLSSTMAICELENLLFGQKE